MNKLSNNLISILRLGSDPSLAELRQAILADVSLPEARRSAIASALNTVGKALRQPLETLPADPLRLRPLLSATTPAMAGLSSGSWRNARSLLHAGLNHLHGNLLPRRLDITPSDGWAVCLESLSKASRLRYHLARLARYATQQGVEPEGVNDAFMVRYEADLTQRSLTAEPARVARDTASAWNEAASLHPDWPQLQLTIPDNRVRHSLPWADYPVSLQLEVERWLDWLGRDVFADRDFRPQRPASLLHRQKQLALYLGALVTTGQEPASMTSLASVVTPDHAKRALRAIHLRGGETLSSHLAHIANMVVIIARHWVKLDDAQIGILRRLERQLRPTPGGLAERNETRLAQLNDPRVLERVLTLPQTLIAQLRGGGAPHAKSAQQFQTAVAIEIFLMTGLRISNVAGLEIGRSLVLRKDGGIDLLIPRTEVKNNIPISADLPPTSAAMIRRYIKVYRPLLGEPNSPWLFPGSKPGTHKTSGGLRDQVTLAMERVCGIAWHPHLFRHLLAFLQLENDAGADGVVTRALAHKRSETTRQHYTGFQTKAAIRKHDELVMRRRAAWRGPRKGRPA